MGAKSSLIPEAKPAPRVVRRDPEVARRLEARLEDWLEANPAALDALGPPLSVEARQVYCRGHEGTIDLVCRRRDRRDAWVVIELKADEVRRDAIAQVLGYVAWLREDVGTDEVTGVVIGLQPHRQVQWVLDAVDGVDIAHWSDFDLPDDLRDELGLEA